MTDSLWWDETTLGPWKAVQAPHPFTGTYEPPSWLPIWLANLEWTLDETDERNVRERTAVLLWFAVLGERWLNRTHIAGDPVARLALGRALRIYFAWGDWREVDRSAPQVFVRRGCNLLRSLRT